MYEKDIWDDVNQEWISWDDIDDEMDESDYQYNYLFYEKYIQPHKNTTNASNKSQLNTPNPSNKQIKNNNIKHLRKPHMALHKKQKVLENHIKEHIESIVPSKVPKEISSFFPPEIWDTMGINIKKDIDELFKVYKYQQWTATILMASRLLENILKVHVEYDLKEDTVKNIGEAIEKLKKHKYDTDLLNELDNYRIKRNSFMHGHERACSSEAKESVVFVISKTLQIYNNKSE